LSASEAISPTAHYTGYVWARNGLSHPELSTVEGRVLFESLRPLQIASTALGGASLEHAAGLAIITEGLLGYLPSEAVDGMWRRFARVMSAFARGRYISDLHIRGVQTAEVRLFRALLSVFVRGRVHVHFDDCADGEASLVAAGFERAEAVRARELAREVLGPGSELVHIIEASIR
jgi:O-methyltransferase involved in polyketide biosynthesis